MATPREQALSTLNEITVLIAETQNQLADAPCEDQDIALAIQTAMKHLDEAMFAIDDVAGIPDDLETEA